MSGDVEMVAAPSLDAEGARQRLSSNWTGCSGPGSCSSQSMASQMSALCQPRVSTVRLIPGHTGKKRTDFWGWPEVHIHRDCLKRKRELRELKRSCNTSRSTRLEQVRQTFSVIGREDMLLTPRSCRLCHSCTAWANGWETVLQV